MALAIAVAAMMIVTSGMASAAVSSQAGLGQNSNVQVNVITGTTQKMNGGDWVAIVAGDVVIAVIYGTSTHPNDITLLTEQKRYLGGADVYDENGDLLRSQGIPIDLVFAARLVNIIEYNDTNHDNLFDLRWMNNVTGLGDKPIKAVSLTLPWTMSDLQIKKGDIVTTVNLTLTATNVPYSWVWQGSSVHPRAGVPSDGNVSEIAFTMHLKFVKGEISVQDVPWYHVVIRDNEVVNSTPEAPRGFNATVLNGTIKYDQKIEGWDFASSTDRLAVETGILAGVHATGPVATKLQQGLDEMKYQDDNGTDVADATGQGHTTPVFSRNTLRLNDTWDRVGSVVWEKNVTVDGNQKQMLFQVQNGGKVTFENNRNLFVGFLARAAFIYPAGQNIFHDPLIQSSSSALVLGTQTPAFPRGIVMIQLVVVVLGVAAAVAAGIFLKQRSDKKRPPAVVTQERPGPLSPDLPIAQPPQSPAPPFTGRKDQ